MLTLLCAILVIFVCGADGEQVSCETMSKSGHTELKIHGDDDDIGVNSSNLSHQKRIFGGQQAKPGDVPWQARINIINGTERAECGATILSEYWLLTAAHCYINGSNSTLYVGDYEIDVIDEGEQMFEIDEFIYHKNYFVLDEENSSSGYDIALVKIKPNNGHGIIFNDFVQPACLPDVDSKMDENMTCAVSGWGAMKDGDKLVNILRYAYMPIVQQSSCHTYYIQLEETLRFTDKWFCAGYLGGGNDACLGDSGGPLVCDYDGKITVYGITSWGHSCGYGPGFYTNVKFFLPWIKENMN